MPTTSLFMSPTAPFPELSTEPRILRPTGSSGYIGRIFDTYLWQLRHLDQAVVPRLSLAAYTELLLLDDTSGSHHVADLSWLPAYLQVLSGSLNSLCECFEFASHLLDDFVHEAGSDFQQFAANKRAEDARWFGYLDPLDVSPDGNSIVLRTESEALAAYQLATLLAPYFSSTTKLGERIGSSGPSTFNVFNNMLLNGFSLPAHDALSLPRGSVNFLTYPWTQEEPLPALDDETDEETDCQYLADRTLTGPEVIEQLTNIIKTGQEAATLYHSLAPGDASGFARLHQLLATICNR